MFHAEIWRQIHEKQKLLKLIVLKSLTNGVCGAEQKIYDFCYVHFPLFELFCVFLFYLFC